MCIEPLRTYLSCSFSVLSQTWWSPWYWMTACLQLQPEFCSRENLLIYFKRQQNEKAKQNPLFCLCPCLWMLLRCSLMFCHSEMFVYHVFCFWCFHIDLVNMVWWCPLLLLYLINSLSVMRNIVFSKIRQAFTITNNMASSGLLENVILTKIILTTDGTIGCAKSNTWCQMVWPLIVAAGPHTYQCCMM